MANKAECIEQAKIIREAASRYLASGKKAFKGEADMLKVYSNDAKDLREVAKLLREGKVKDAYRKAQYLDTLVRDVIPESPWRFMGRSMIHD